MGHFPNTPYEALVNGNIIEKGIAANYLQSDLVADEMITRAYELKGFNYSLDYIEDVLMDEFDINELTNADLDRVNDAIEAMF